MPVGPGQVLTPVDVEQELLTLLNRLDEGQRFLAEKDAEATERSMTYDLAFARALIRASASSAEGRKAEALLACEDLYRNQVLAESVVRTTRERMKVLYTSVEVVRSLGASVRASTVAAGYGL
jgi:hypothetical protein